MTCNYCDKPAERVTGNAIYPHRPDLFGKTFYRCKPCDAYVGCHPGTTEPLGLLANHETRKWRQKAHAAFDPIWKTGRMNRKDAYRALSEALGICEDNCHIGRFEPEMCKRVLEAAKTLGKEPSDE